MKIAIAYFGHSRSFMNTYQSHYNHLINLTKADVFFHTWRESDTSLPSWYTKDNQNVNVNDIDLISIYEPKSYIIDDNPKPKIGEDVFFYNTDISNVHNYLTSILSVLDLVVKDNNKYDLIILTRMDIEYHENMKIYSSNNIISYPMNITIENYNIHLTGLDLINQFSYEKAKVIISNINYIIDNLSYVLRQHNISRFEELFHYLCRPYMQKYKAMRYSILRSSGKRLYNKLYYNKPINIKKPHKHILLNERTRKLFH